MKSSTLAKIVVFVTLITLALSGGDSDGDSSNNSNSFESSIESSFFSSSTTSTTTASPLASSPVWAQIKADFARSKAESLSKVLGNFPQSRSGGNFYFRSAPFGFSSSEQQQSSAELSADSEAAAFKAPSSTISTTSTSITPVVSNSSKASIDICSKEKTGQYRELIAEYYRTKLADESGQSLSAFSQSFPPHLHPEPEICEASMLLQKCYKQKQAALQHSKDHNQQQQQQQASKVRGWDFRERIMMMVSAPLRRLTDECESTFSHLAWNTASGNVFGGPLEHTPHHRHYHHQHYNSEESSQDYEEDHPFVLVDEKGQDIKVANKSANKQPVNKNQSAKTSLQAKVSSREEGHDFLFYLRIFVAIHVFLVALTLLAHFFPRGNPLLGRIWHRRRIVADRNRVTQVRQRDVANARLNGGWAEIPMSPFL